MIFIKELLFGQTWLAATYVSFSVNFNTRYLNPFSTINGRPATVCILVFTPQNFAASIPNNPALGVWVCTISGFSFLKMLMS